MKSTRLQLQSKKMKDDEMEINPKKAILYSMGVCIALLVLNTTHHSLFVFLISVTPEILCTVILLAVLLSYDGGSTPKLPRNDGGDGRRVIEKGGGGETSSKLKDEVNAKGQIERKYKNHEEKREAVGFGEKDEHAMKLDGDGHSGAFNKRKEDFGGLVLHRDRDLDGKEDAERESQEEEENVMELRVCEAVRFQRLESLIEKRRLRKLQRYETEKNLIDLDSYYPVSLISSISAPRRNMFDSEGNLRNSPVPSSAPSFLQPSASPFDLPNEQKDEVSTLSNEYLSHHDFVPASRRGPSINMRESCLGDVNQEKCENKTVNPEEAKRLAYRRQLSRRSSSKLRYSKTLSSAKTEATHIEQGRRADLSDDKHNDRTETDYNHANELTTSINIEESHQVANDSDAVEKNYTEVKKLHVSDTERRDIVEERYNDSDKKDCAVNVDEESTMVLPRDELSSTNTEAMQIEQGSCVYFADGKHKESRTETHENNDTDLNASTSIKEIHQAANEPGAMEKEDVAKLHGSDTKKREIIEEMYEDLDRKDSANVHEYSTDLVLPGDGLSSPTEDTRTEQGSQIDLTDDRHKESGIDSNNNHTTDLNMSISTQDAEVQKLQGSDIEKQEVVEERYEDSEKTDYPVNIYEDSTNLVLPRDELSSTTTEATQIEQGSQTDVSDDKQKESRTDTENNHATDLNTSISIEDAEVKKMHVSDIEKREVVEERYEDSEKKDSAGKGHGDSTTQLLSSNELSSTTTEAIIFEQGSEVDFADDKHNAIDLNASISIEDVELKELHGSDTEKREVIEERYQDSQKKDSVANVHEDSTTLLLPGDESVQIQGVDDAQVAEPVYDSDSSPLAIGESVSDISEPDENLH